MPTYPGGRAKPVRVADHDPNNKDLYRIDWSDWLLENEETISASQWIIPSDLTSEAEAFSDTAATIKISGGTEGEKYTLTNRITTAINGLVQDRSCWFFCKHY
jgi:hypothetical protein